MPKRHSARQRKRFRQDLPSFHPDRFEYRGYITAVIDICLGKFSLIDGQSICTNIVSHNS